jgi:hypothetical protein
MHQKDTSFYNLLTTHPKKLFLIDSFGAFLTAFLLGIVLSSFEEYIGIPKKILVALSLIASLFGVYSLVCHFFVCKHWRIFLSAIALANVMYCCLTIAMVLYYINSIQILGIAYFFGEILIIGSLVYIELMNVKTLKN